MPAPPADVPKVPLAPASGDGPRVQLDPQSARVLTIALATTSVAFAAFAAVVLTRFPEHSFRLPGLGTALAVMLFTAGPLHRQEGARAIRRLLVGVTCYFIVAGLFEGGLRQPLMMTLPVVVVFAGWLLGRRMARTYFIVTVVLSVLLGAGMAIGWIAERPPLPSAAYFVLVITIQAMALVMTLFAHGAHGRLRRELAQARDDLRQAAMTDALTGLANRVCVDERFAHALAGARRNASRLAIVAIDLDGFKPINDTHGHVAGDHLLRHVARQLRGAVREADTVGRVGGDEFVVIAEGLADRDQAVALAGKLLAAVTVATDWQGAMLGVGASIGIALFPDHGADAKTLFVAADTAMYAAKRAGRHRVCVAGAP